MTSRNESLTLELPAPPGPVQVHVLFNASRRISIRVHPDRRVTVNAPPSMGMKPVREVLESKKGWIIRHLNGLPEHPPIPAEYLPGSTHFFLGEPCRLVVHRAHRSGATLLNREIHLRTRVPESTGRVRSILRLWYRDQAMTVIGSRVSLWLPGPAPETRFRWMRRRWGSCSSTGLIVFNTQLVKAPVSCIDFVVVHELCHLLHPHHGPEFRTAMDGLMPDWRERRKGLRNLPFLL